MRFNSRAGYILKVYFQAIILWMMAVWVYCRQAPNRLPVSAYCWRGILNMQIRFRPCM